MHASARTSRVFDHRSCCTWLRFYLCILKTALLPLICSHPRVCSVYCLQRLTSASNRRNTGCPVHKVSMQLQFARKRGSCQNTESVNFTIFAHYATRRANCCLRFAPESSSHPFFSTLSRAREPEGMDTQEK